MWHNKSDNSIDMTVEMPTLEIALRISKILANIDENAGLSEKQKCKKEEP